MNGQFVLVKDGDTIVVLAKTDITVSDPCDEYPYVSQAYRVVADRPGPTLALVPLDKRAKRVSKVEIDQFLERQRLEEKVVQSMASVILLLAGAQENET